MLYGSLQVLKVTESEELLYNIHRLLSACELPALPHLTFLAVAKVKTVGCLSILLTSRLTMLKVTQHTLYKKNKPEICLLDEQ